MLRGELCTLAWFYQADPADILFALMEALQRPLLRERVDRELCGRIASRLYTQRRSYLRWFFRQGSVALLNVAFTRPFIFGLDAYSALEVLSTKERLALIGKYVEGMTIKELVVVLGFSNETQAWDTVRLAKQKARQRLTRKPVSGRKKSKTTSRKK